jgi:hypothetical protein
MQRFSKLVFKFCFPVPAQPYGLSVPVHIERREPSNPAVFHPHGQDHDLQQQQVSI